MNRSKEIASAKTPRTELLIDASQ